MSESLAEQQMAEAWQYIGLAGLMSDFEEHLHLMGLCGGIEHNCEHCVEEGLE
jgi:hypothetical protein